MCYDNNKIIADIDISPRMRSTSTNKTNFTQSQTEYNPSTFPENRKLIHIIYRQSVWYNFSFPDIYIYEWKKNKTTECASHFQSHNNTEINMHKIKRKKTKKKRVKCVLFPVTFQMQMQNLLFSHPAFCVVANTANEETWWCNSIIPRFGKRVYFALHRAKRNATCTQ